MQETCHDLSREHVSIGMTVYWRAKFERENWLPGQDSNLQPSS